MSSFLIGLVVSLAPLQGGPAGELPFESLGRALLQAAEDEPDGSGSRRASFPGSLEPLFEVVDLGAVELWLPRTSITHSGKLEPAKRPREWKGVIDALLRLEGRWLGQFEILRGDAAALAEAVGVLREDVRKLPKTGALSLADSAREVARSVRSALLGARSRDDVPVLILSPTRAHFVAVIGAAGIDRPAIRAVLWTEGARRSSYQRLSDTVLLLPLAIGPSADESWYLGEDMQAADVHQHAVHASSHLLSSLALTGLPLWFGEALAIRDTVSIAGTDETLCTGYQGNQQMNLGGLGQTLLGFIFSHTERSPYRGKASSGLFLAELRAALTESGFEILDLERSQVAWIAPGPFLTRDAPVPREVADGAPGLREGFAEFFRAYVTAFVEWLSNEEALDGHPILPQALSRLHVAGYRTGIPQSLEQVLLELSRRTLGVNGDPARDLEAAFVSWLRTPR